MIGIDGMIITVFSDINNIDEVVKPGKIIDFEIPELKRCIILETHIWDKTRIWVQKHITHNEMRLQYQFKVLQVETGKVMNVFNYQVVGTRANVLN